MRTTLDIDDDVLVAVKEMARAQRVSAGRAISDLARQALTRPSAIPGSGAKCVGGFRPFPSRGVPVTNEQVNELRDAEGV